MLVFLVFWVILSIFNLIYRQFSKGFSGNSAMHVCLNSGGKRYSDIADPKTLGEASMAWGIIGILGVIVLLLIKIYPQALRKNPDLANLTMLLALTGA